MNNICGLHFFPWLRRQTMKWYCHDLQLCPQPFGAASWWKISILYIAYKAPGCRRTASYPSRTSTLSVVCVPLAFATFWLTDVIVMLLLLLLLLKVDYKWNISSPHCLHRDNVYRFLALFTIYAEWLQNTCTMYTVLYRYFVGYRYNILATGTTS